MISEIYCPNCNNSVSSSVQSKSDAWFIGKKDKCCAVGKFQVSCLCGIRGPYSPTAEEAIKNWNKTFN